MNLEFMGNENNYYEKFWSLMMVIGLYMSNDKIWGRIRGILEYFFEVLLEFIEFLFCLVFGNK